MNEWGELNKNMLVMEGKARHMDILQQYGHRGPQANLRIRSGLREGGMRRAFREREGAGLGTPDANGCSTEARRAERRRGSG